jgi:hypothetical protein
MPNGKLKVVNLLGSPGQGKSTVRSGVFWLMKTYGMSVEEVSEYAKYLVLSGRTWQLSTDQMYVFAKQHHKQLVLKGQYEYAVTDSPLVLCDFYAPKPYFDSFTGLVREAFDAFENVNFFLSRDLDAAPFEGEGRMHDKEMSKRVEHEMREYLAKRNIPYIDLPIDITTPWRIMEQLKPGLASLPTFGDLAPKG